MSADISPKNVKIDGTPICANSPKYSSMLSFLATPTIAYTLEAMMISAAIIASLAFSGPNFNSIGSITDKKTVPPSIYPVAKLISEAPAPFIVKSNTNDNKKPHSKAPKENTYFSCT